MWTPSVTTSSSSPDIFTHMNAGPTKNAPRQQGLDLSVLESSSLWQPSKTIYTQRDWIKSTVVESPKTWTPRSQSSEPQVKNSNNLWALTVNSRQTSPDMFAYMTGCLVKKASASRPSPLPRLNSSELFGKHSIIAEVNIDWLHSTSKASHALTWTAPSTNQVRLPVRGMWAGRSEISLTSSTRFENPHGQSWNPKKRDEISLGQLESTELWRPNLSIPVSPKNWLINRRVSKVEFRY